MRVLAFSDLHRDLAACDRLVAAGASADLVLGAGDFASAHLGLAETMARLAPLDPKAVYVAGNNETAEALRDATGAQVLHGEAVEVLFPGDGRGGSLVVLGLGGAVPPIEAPDWPSFNLSEEEAEARLALHPRADVLLCHSPPKGVADVFGPLGSIGSVALRRAAERLAPRLMLFGHVHDCWGEEGRIGLTRCRNLGPGVTWFEVEERG